MNRELDKADWKTFFGNLSRDLAEWETTVHILNARSGAQILSEGLPFSRLTYEEKYGKSTIALLLGCGSANYQIHNISKPLRVAFAERGRGPAGTLDIEDASGNTTLITFIQPRRSLLDYGQTKMIPVR